MTLFANEIDSDTPSNLAHIERWQNKYGSIYRKLKKCSCINCKKLIEDNDKVDYVACFNGKLLMWHKECVKN